MMTAFDALAGVLALFFAPRSNRIDDARAVNSWIDSTSDMELYVIADFLEAIVDVPVSGPSGPCIGKEEGKVRSGSRIACLAAFFLRRLVSFMCLTTFQEYSRGWNLRPNRCTADTREARSKPDWYKAQMRQAYSPGTRCAAGVRFRFQPQ